MLQRLVTLAILIFPLHAATITDIQMAISADGGGPWSSCSYAGSGPTATCAVIGSYGIGQAQASTDGSRISVGAGGTGSSARVYVTSTLDALYNTAFTGNLFAMFDYQCAAGGNVASGWAGLSGIICGTGTHPSSIDQTVMLPVQALAGQIQFRISWYAAVFTSGDQEYANSKLSFDGFQDGGGNPVIATIAANAASATVPEPATWALMGLGCSVLAARHRLGRDREKSFEI